MTQNTVASGAQQAPYGQKGTPLSGKQVLVAAVHIVKVIGQMAFLSEMFDIASMHSTNLKFLAG